MLSAYQLQVVCYLSDGGSIYCPKCWTCGSIEQERNAAMCRYAAEQFVADAEWEEYGLTCETCGATIIEPEEVQS
jgi:hypothetical protein